MARKVGNQTGTPEFPVDFAESLDPNGMPEDVERALQELGAGVASVVLYTFDKQGKQSYLCTMGVDEFSLENVKTQYGGGRYFARFRAAGGEFLAGKMFRVDERWTPATVPTAPAPVGGGSELVTVVRELLLEMRDQRNRAPAPASDPMELVAKLGAVSAQNMATMMGVMQSMNKGGGGNAVTPETMMEAVQLGVELAGKGGGGGGEDNELAKTIREFAGPLLQILSRATNSAPQRPAAAVTEGKVVGTIAPTDAPAAAQGEPPWVALLRPHIPQLVKLASENADTNLWAAVIDSQAPKMARWLEGAARDPEFVDALLQKFPELVAYRTWCVHLLEEFAVEEEPDELDELDEGDGPAEPAEPDGPAT